MIGLVLQGGGAKGSYHIGVWKALRELEINIGAVTGTSVGALIGAYIVQDMFDVALNVFLNMDPSMVIKDDPDIFHQLTTKNIDINNISLYIDYIRTIIKQKGFDIQPLYELMQQHVDETKMRLSMIDFGLVTVSLTDWKAIEVFIEDIEEGKLVDYMLASSYLPAFKPQMLDGKRFIDGAFFDNLPINLMKKKNYDEIVAVELDSIGRIRPIKDKNLNIRRISPSGDTGSMFEFDQERARSNITMGYLDAMKSYGKNEGMYYYITDVPNVQFFNEFILNLSDVDICTMAEIIGYNEGVPFRILTEKIIPELCNMLGLDLTMTYKDMIISVIEFLAETYEIERLKVYTYNQLLELVVKENNVNKNRIFDISLMPAVLRRQNIVQKTFKVNLISRWLDIAYGDWSAKSKRYDIYTSRGTI